MKWDSAIETIACRLGAAESVLFITGAGISADSGLPTYRGVGGLYDGQATAEGIPIEEALSGEMLARRPELTWKYLAQIGDSCRGARPNAAHEAIARLEKRITRVTVLTQNVDGLHRLAGSGDVIEIHGNLQELLCTRCGYEESADSVLDQVLPPRCPDCRHVLRPQVILFGEALPGEALERLYSTLEEGVDMIFSIGTSSVFPYIAEPVVWAAQVGIATVEINPVTTRLSSVVDYQLPLGAAEAMTAIMATLERGG